MALKRSQVVYISPLTLVTLSACGGDSSNVTSVAVAISQTVSGNVVNGPLSSALVFLDLNSNGILDGSETSVRTDINGSFSLSTTSSNYEIVALTDDTTIDTSSGQVLSGVTLKAPSNASMISPTTTLMQEADLTPDQVAEVLGLPEGVDPLSFNPYADGVNADNALAVAKISKQITTAIKSFASASEGAGASEKDSFEAALKSVVDVVKTKAGNLGNSSASAADKKLDFTKSEDLNLIKVKAVAEVASKSGVNVTAFGNLIEDATTSIKNVNDIINGITDLSSDTTKDIFATSTALSKQIKSAIGSEAISSGSGSISLSDSNFALKVSKNEAPSMLSLTANKVTENASSLVVGNVQTVDRDQPEGVAFRYEIVEVGSDYDKFTINQETGELSLKNKPNYSNQKEYQVTISVTDAGGKSIAHNFTIEVINPVGLNDVSKSVSSEVNAQNISDSGNDKTLLVVIDNFSERVHEYSNTTLYDYGYLDVVTYYDNLYNVYSGQFTGYGTYDDSWIDIPDLSGGFYQVTPDKDSTSDLDLDLIDNITFTDSLGNTAYADTYLSFEKVSQKSEVEVAHGDWVVEAICQTLVDPSKTEILCIDVDTLTNDGDFGKLFHNTSYALDGVTYTGTNIKKILEDFFFYNDSRSTENQSDYVYTLSGITMSLSGAASAPNYASSFISELETYKIPFFQSAPNVNKGVFDWSTFVPNVISVGAWNVDGSDNLLVASETAIPTIDLYANGYIQKADWGETFGTSFATPTAAAAFADYLNAFIKQLHASGQTVEDIEISDDQLAAIDYTNFIDSVVGLISKPVDIGLNFLGSPLTDVRINILEETLQNDGTQPVKVNFGSGIQGLTLSSITAVSDGNSTSTESEETSTPSSSTDTTGPLFSDFSILENKITSGSGIKVRFKMSDAAGIDQHSVNVQFKKLDGQHDSLMLDLDPSQFVKQDNGFFEVTSTPIQIRPDLFSGIYEISLIQMRDNLGNWTAFTKDSNFISNLTDANKQIILEHNLETEPNNSKETSTDLGTLGRNDTELISGNLLGNNDFDFYSFSLENNISNVETKIRLNVSKYENDLDNQHYLALYKKGETDILSQTVTINEYGAWAQLEEQLDAGDYFVSISGIDDATYNLMVDIA